MLVHPQFDPVAIQIGSFGIHWYGLMYLVGFLSLLWLGKWRLRRQPLPGWQLQDMPAMNYVMANSVSTGPDYRPTEPGAINGGLFQRPTEAPSPAIYVGVASVDDAIREVTAAGGKVVTPKTPIPGMGAYGRILDPEGNVIGLFEGAQ